MREKESRRERGKRERRGSKRGREEREKRDRGGGEEMDERETGPAAACKGGKAKRVKGLEGAVAGQ